MTSIGNLIKILGEVFHDLEARGETVPKELIELIDYCENYHPIDIKIFNSLFDSCKEKLNELSSEGYIYFRSESDRDKFFRDLDELKENITKTQTYSQEEILIRQLHTYSAILYRLLIGIAKKNYEQDLRLILLGPNELLDSSIRFLSKLEHEIHSGVAGRLKIILGILLSGAYSPFITNLFMWNR